ncbi:uncharacterized mitochondrial protein-like protein, partial [Tanacetum coccineum]
MEVFMDDFLVFGNSFGTCLSHLDKMLKRCEDTNLCLNWEKSHFMVKEGIVPGHKISKNGIEVDKAKVDVIAKLPHPTTIKGVPSFLVARHSVPISIISDRDSRFTSKFYGIAMRRVIGSLDMSTAYHPQTDGQSEHTIQTLETCIEQSVVRQLCGLRWEKKSYADKRRKPLEFSVGDYVLLKVSPWKGVVRFGKKGKLAPRYLKQSMARSGSDLKMAELYEQNLIYLGLQKDSQEAAIRSIVSEQESNVVSDKKSDDSKENSDESLVKEQVSKDTKAKPQQRVKPSDLDTECLVLSPNFKLPDENQILLKIPKKDNMYSFDMKNIVPKKLTCTNPLMNLGTQGELNARYKSKEIIQDFIVMPILESASYFDSLSKDVDNDEPISIVKALSDSSYWRKQAGKNYCNIKLQQVLGYFDIAYWKEGHWNKMDKKKMEVKMLSLYGTTKEKVYVYSTTGLKILTIQTNFTRINIVAEILRKFNYTDVKSASTPVDLEKPLVKDRDANDVVVHLYRSMIGSLMYLTASRPYIMFAVCACARFQVTPKTSHLLAVKRIFRYLKGKPTLGLWYSRDSPFELVAYTDSDYAGATQDRKSTTGGYLLTKGFDAGRFVLPVVCLYCQREISTASIKRTVVTRVNTASLIFEVSTAKKELLLLVATDWFKGKLTDSDSFKWIKGYYFWDYLKQLITKRIVYHLFDGEVELL